MNLERYVERYQIRFFDAERCKIQFFYAAVCAAFFCQSFPRERLPRRAFRGQSSPRRS